MFPEMGRLEFQHIWQIMARNIVNRKTILSGDFFHYVCQNPVVFHGNLLSKDFFLNHIFTLETTTTGVRSVNIFSVLNINFHFYIEKKKEKNRGYN